jgi:quercetin dioxygenase-like cupin family protein
MTMKLVLAVAASGLGFATSAACRSAPDATAPAPPTTTAPEPAPGQPRPGEPRADGVPDSPLTGPVGANLSDLSWSPAPAGLPPGAEVAVLEGTPPFDQERSFAMVVRVPPHYTIPPHQHLVTERVTVLQGRVSFGHGPVLERGKATVLGQGAIVLMPTGHTHYAFTDGDETIVLLQGVGPWGIYYIDPRDDPRPQPVEMPKGFVSRYDAPLSPTLLQAHEARFSPAPDGMLPAGAQLAMIEGDLQQRQNFVMRLRVPDGYRLPTHRHDITNRIVVISGALRVGLGDTWQDDQMIEMRPGAVAIIPAGSAHYAQARGETVLQIMGTGPYHFTWLDPAEDPARQPQARASR